MSGPTPKVRRLVADRDQHRCFLCGCGGPMQVHHRLPRRAGGTTRPETNGPANLVCLCPFCHAWVEHNRTDGYELGLLLHDGDRPDRTPVNGWRGPLLLDADGATRPAGQINRAIEEWADDRRAS